MIDLALDALSWLCLGGGTLFCVIGSIGVLRLPDVYARTHATSITDTLGAGLILLGLVFQAEPLVAIKLLMVYAFMMFSGPASSHALVKAAFANGVRAQLVPGGEPDPDDEDLASMRPPTGSGDPPSSDADPDASADAAPDKDGGDA